ncbi:MAG: MptD family putative ECF transporter S component, partial [Bifidobacterium sp.]|nr:MptD family putative ECF transporter S component [Bifidobacterium sp.]
MTAQANTATTCAKLSVPDMITTGVFTAIYFCIVGVCALVCNVVSGGAANIMLPALAALLAGPVYMLLAARVRTFGAISVMGIVLGLFLFVSGHFATSLITSVVFSLLADLVARIGAHRNKAALLGSYVVFSFGCVGPIMPMWMMKDAYVANLARKGKDTAYIDHLFSYVNGVSLVVVIVAI